jgi:hypothetical protein
MITQAAMIVAACFFAGAQPAPSPGAGKPVIVWRVAESRVGRGFGFVEIQNLPPASLAESSRWTPEQWQRAFTVSVETGNVVDIIEIPAMAGSYQVAGNVLRFTPQFPFEPGVSYDAVLRLARLPGFQSDEASVSSVHRMPKPKLAPTTVVSAVFPSADVLPENLLKFYIHFSAPMSGGHIYEHIRLLNESGKPVELPFLEIDEELWNPDMTRLTLFIDPGRIKRGVQPLEEIGPTLETGKGFTLVIDRAWLDASSQPLKSDFKKPFRVTAPVREALDPAKWKLVEPGAGSRTPLTVDFHQPMDHALTQRALRIADPAGQPVAGEVSLSDNERRWTFSPNTEWISGVHTLLIHSTLEDLSGNNIGKPFEVDLFEGVQRRITNAIVSVPFTVR